MHLKITEKIISLIAISLLVASIQSSAQTVDMKGAVIIPYKSGWFSSKPDEQSNKEALKQAKLEVWKLYTSKFNDAKMKIYLGQKDKFLNNIDQYVQNISVVDKVIDKDAKQIKLVVRATINETAVDAALGLSSQAATQGTGQGAPFVFIFLARSASSIKAYDDKKTSVNKREKSSATEERNQQTEDTDAASSKSSDMEVNTTGGTVERKKSKITYEVTSSQDIDSAMGSVLSTSGFEVISYDDVVSNCGGIDRSEVAKEFTQYDDMSMETRKSIVTASRSCEVRLFAIGTLDVGVQDTDPVSGGKRVAVSVRGQVWSLDAKLPRKIASVGPVQYSGLGADDVIAARNALNLAARESAKIIVDQLNAKGVK